jgi:hypothetical protein
LVCLFIDRVDFESAVLVDSAVDVEVSEVLEEQEVGFDVA